MIDFICNNPVTVAVIAIILIAIIVLFLTNRKDILRKAALYAVARAEDAWGSNTGRIKFAEVYTYLKKTFPIITFFVTEKALSNIIETALTSLKQIIETKQVKDSEDKLEEK